MIFIYIHTVLSLPCAECKGETSQDVAITKVVVEAVSFLRTCRICGKVSLSQMTPSEWNESDFRPMPSKS